MTDTVPGNVLLHVADVHKHFGGLHALSDIDLQVEEGKTHAIIGPNGAGKSTLLNVIIGRLAPTSGAVVFDGQVLTGRKPHQINQMGVVRVFQTPEIFPDLSVLHNVMAPAFAKRDGAFRVNILKPLEAETALRDEAEAILEDVGLYERRTTHAGALSRGDKRRMELAMCLIQRPRLLLLDEPTAGMSRHDTNTTIDLLKKIKARGMTKVIIEHDMHVVFSLADKISVLSGGRIIAEGLPDEVRGNVKVQEAYLGGAHRLEAVH
jgi:branched-chain amino acid transport system ATP-binding protein